MPDRDERRGSADTRSSEFREHWVSTLLFVLTVLTVSFGFNGFRQQHIELVAQGNPPTVDWTIPVYRTVQLLMLNSGAEEPDNSSLAVARMLAACTFLVLTAAVVRKVFHDSTQLPQRLTRTGHTVICGLGNVGGQLVDDLCRLGKQRRLVVIEQDEANLALDRARRAGVDVVIGDATRAETLRRARAHCAEAVFAVLGDDGANLEIASELDEVLTQRPSVRRRRGHFIPLRLVMHLRDVKLATAFQTLSQSASDPRLLDVSVFSVARTSATHVVTKALWPFAPRQRNEVAHFVILGFGPMGRALAVTLARLGHFPNGQRSRFTIADSEVQESARDFLSRFPRFTAWSDARIGVSRFDSERDHWSSRTETVPLQLASESSDAIDYVANARFQDLAPDAGDELFCRELLDSFVDPQVTVKPVIFLCGEDDGANFQAAVRMRDTLDRLGGNEVPIFVWLPRQPALAIALRRHATLIPFGEYHDSAGLQELLDPQQEQLARAVHHYYQQLAVQSQAQPRAFAWHETRDEFRESNRQFAEHFHIKLAYLGRRLVNPIKNGGPPAASPMPPIDEAAEQVLAEMEHNRWIAERLMGGWRHGPTPRSPEEKEANGLRRRHHSLVPWEKLGSDRSIDHALLAAILAAAQKRHYQLQPLD